MNSKPRPQKDSWRTLSAAAVRRRLRDSRVAALLSLPWIYLPSWLGWLYLQPSATRGECVPPTHTHTHTHTLTHTEGIERMERKREKGGSPDAKAATESCPRSLRFDSHSFSSLNIYLPSFPLPPSLIFSSPCNFFYPNARMCKSRVMIGSCASMRFVVSVHSLFRSLWVCVIVPGPRCVSPCSADSLLQSSGWGESKAVNCWQ